MTYEELKMAHETGVLVEAALLRYRAERETGACSQETADQLAEALEALIDMVAHIESLLGAFTQEHELLKDNHDL